MCITQHFRLNFNIVTLLWRLTDSVFGKLTTAHSSISTYNDTTVYTEQTSWLSTCFGRDFELRHFFRSVDKIDKTITSVKFCIR